MMLNVSRTPVSESWLSTLKTTKPPVGYNALDKEAFVTLEKSRFSVSTIDAELFPELLSWSAWTNALPHSRAQTIPSDITKPDGTDTMHETDTIHEIDNTLHENIVHEADVVNEANSLFSPILDPTAMEFGFDQSCFEGLDDFLIHDPFEAFLESCWLDAIGRNVSVPATRITTPTELLNKPARRKLPPLPVTIQTPKEHDGDLDDIPTYEESAFSPPAIQIEFAPIASPLLEPNLPWSNRNTGISTFVDDDEATSFVIFEAPALNPTRYDSVGHFPIPSSRPHKNVVSSRIPTFCTNLPAPFTSVR